MVSVVASCSLKHGIDNGNLFWRHYYYYEGCEAKYKATKTLYLKEGNYDGRSNLPAKYIDALGILKTHNNMEMVVVESPRY